MAEVKTYEGWLSLKDWGEGEDILFLSGTDEPLVDELEWMRHKKVTVRYWITDAEVTKKEPQKCHLQTLYGDAHVWFESVYTEATGFLWVEEELQIGGHDLAIELKSASGRYLILIIEYETEGKPDVSEL